jgi:electron transfer flavoprotein beta subunit
MNIVVAVKLVPDLVEELDIAESGDALDRTWLRLILNEPDDHAIEQAILLKERTGGQVTIVAPDVEGVDDILFTGAAKGADKLIKLNGDFEDGVNNHALARAFAGVIGELNPDLLLTGVQANDDLDGAVGPLLAEMLGLPYVGYVSGVALGNDARCTVHKEYPGGLRVKMTVELPAALGIQAAEEPPRYVAISRVRQAMKSAAIDETALDDLNQDGGPTIARMYQLEAGERATILDGDEDEVAGQLIEIFQELGIL